MKEKFQNKYRIESTRLKSWNYAGEGLYFITVMVQNYLCVFGKIRNGIMIPNDWGKIIIEEWNKSFKIRKELKCIEFILMPNHLHAIVRLVNEKSQEHENVETHSLNNVETHGSASLTAIKENRDIEKYQRNVGIAYRKPKSISSFVAGFKSSVTTKINYHIDENMDQPLLSMFQKFNRNHKLWQTNYHDHVIRDNDTFYKIKNYIRSNPKNWKADGYYKE